MIVIGESGWEGVREKKLTGIEGKETLIRTLYEIYLFSIKV